MNPAILEASDDLTNLSHLNEPAGRSKACHLHPYRLTICSPPGHTVTVFPKRDLHVQRHRPHCNQSIREGGLSLRTGNGSSVRGKATVFTVAPPVRDRRGGILVSYMSPVRKGRH